MVSIIEVIKGLDKIEINPYLSGSTLVNPSKLPDGHSFVGVISEDLQRLATFIQSEKIFFVKIRRSFEEKIAKMIFSSDEDQDRFYNGDYHYMVREIVEKKISIIVLEKIFSHDLAKQIMEIIGEDLNLDRVVLHRGYEVVVVKDGEQNLNSVKAKINAYKEEYFRDMPVIGSKPS